MLLILVLVLTQVVIVIFETVLLYVAVNVFSFFVVLLYKTTFKTDRKDENSVA